MESIRILGVDPGLNITGYGVVTADAGGCRLEEAGIIRGGSTRKLESRIRAIHEGIAEVITQMSPDTLSLEELFSHYQRPRTAILMGHARGVICLAAAQQSLPVVGYSATQVKRILTGSGRAPKHQVQQAIQRELGLPETPQPADVADALAIAMCHVYLSGSRNSVVATSTRPPHRPGRTDPRASTSPDSGSLPPFNSESTP